MTSSPHFRLFKACLITFLLVLLQIPVSMALADEPEQALSVVHIGLETTSVNVTVTDSSGASAEFPGYVTSDSPFLTLDAEITVMSSTWPASADPSTIHIKGRANESFTVIMNVTAGVANGTVGAAHIMIAAVATSPGRSYTSQTEYQLTATVTNSDEVKANEIGGGLGPGGTKITITTGSTNKTKAGSDPIRQYLPVIAVFAVIGIIAGAYLKIKGRRQRLARQQPKVPTVVKKKS